MSLSPPAIPVLERDTTGRRLWSLAADNPFLPVASISLLALLLITVFLFREGLPLFSSYSLGHFLFGRAWYPTDEGEVVTDEHG